MGYLIEQKNIPLDHQTEAELDSAAFAIGYLVHVPVQVDVENVKKAVSPFFVSVPSDGVQKGRNKDVASDHRIHCPWIRDGHSVSRPDRVMRRTIQCQGR